MVCETNLIWMDLEMTGLNPEKDRIIEIATIVTDAQLNVVAEGPVLAIHQPGTILAQMDSWCTKTHTKSGLVARVKASKVTEADAQAQTIDFLKQHVKKGVAPLCGNSIWQDRRFLGRYMPELEAYCHYHIVDVSTFKELARRWSPKVYKGFKKVSKHVALDDIRESIEELRYYRQQVWKEDK